MLLAMWLIVCVNFCIVFSDEINFRTGQMMPKSIHKRTALNLMLKA